MLGTRGVGGFRQGGRDYGEKIPMLFLRYCSHGCSWGSHSTTSIYGVSDSDCIGTLRGSEAECGEYPSKTLSVANCGSGGDGLGDTQSLGDGGRRGTVVGMCTPLSGFVLVSSSG